jgi:hypothetical protein
VKVVFPREANAKKGIDFFQLMHLECGFRLSNGESCVQALIYVFNVFCDGVLETAKGDGSLGLTQLLGVIFDLVHIAARGSKQDRCQACLQREEESALTTRPLILIIPLHASGLIFIVYSMICRDAV